MTLLYVFIAALILVYAPTAICSLYVAFMVFRGVYPKRGDATMLDVERLIDQEKFTLAQRCYRQLTKSSLKDAASATARMRAERMNMGGQKE